MMGTVCPVRNKMIIFIQLHVVVHRLLFDILYFASNESKKASVCVNEFLVLSLSIVDDIFITRTETVIFCVIL